MLLNREQELRSIDGLLADAKAGAGGALVFRGDPGIGLTTLLDYAGGAASDMRVIRVTGIETEFHLAFAGLQQVCAPLFDGLDALPHRQRAALESALGLNGGESPESRASISSTTPSGLTKPLSRRSLSSPAGSRPS